jgi:hypothetical protein
MPIPIQNFGTLRPTLSGSELLPLVVADGSGNYTDHRRNAPQPLSGIETEMGCDRSGILFPSKCASTPLRD